MKVLLDHCVPSPFSRLLIGHEVRTAKEMGWAALDNGKLLAKAAPQFDAFVTVDKHLMNQQHVGELPLPVIVVRVFDNTIDSLARFAPALLRLLNQPLNRRVYVLRDPE